ncbi:MULTISPECIES: dUTP diphosphatase [Methylobacterium]|uniref:dUTP diphosphatase n=1 Tax=Methylobacterium jeotgali TaxID=381630 RepID=A0ABQ4SZG1_9HYPH|nr:MULTISPECIES: dUTP diphosphatase [Methylobacterium]PIU04778.1 MAG: dUTP diphosphatase [Methylobacterium sp. CG09_land_8_20_14_0_10_71_15]PIU16254.1 MAG: dUTP diphosphatase [Methylobacterium sp. CG08_land_8_20_14_0_20_71_15]GBU17184.1 deoxyuridine 5'-triphosphate nucleotidohydrolase [Methylobacterium sp.]GJE07900.1 Deoxyuridine 5'-triphosphate nucleotidohydrolase [Methylobacterium jeotgali]
MTPPDAPAVGIRLLDPRLADWGFPRWGSEMAAGLDLHACIPEPLRLAPQAAAILVPSGFSLRIGDPGWCALVLPRSGFGHRDGLVMGNGTGVIDADYEGEILISAWNRNPAPSPAIVIEPGDRIAQLVFTRIGRPRLAFVAADDGTPGSARGARGFGSSGRR